VTQSPGGDDGRVWTLEEANAALERITEVVERARVAMASARDRAATVADRAKGNGHPPPSTTGALAEAITELAREGIVLRDAEQGLIDFPARAPSGRAYWLCWIVGEPAVAWWHWPEDGFAGRTPIAQPPT
jgi:hypothetical protein